MKKMFFVTFLIVCAALAGRETHASVQQVKAEDPCFISSSSWYPCEPGFYVAGYPQEDGTYYYYAWQCSSFSCPL